ncbi:MAG: double-strand break repair helicase AddA [Paracoccaceae bacterium]
MRPNDATRDQIAAADPDASTWLSANAGSGKTRVLTDRVARLLLKGVSPQRILCLTYTKAAASEMQNRLFGNLGEWAMMPDQKLTDRLRELGLEAAEIDPSKLRGARRLFAKAIETPGGLKIQTIHSFCAALLRRFPMEAGVSPAFVEMDDRNAKLMRAELLEQIALSHPEAMAGLAQHYSGGEIDSFLQELSGRRALFSRSVSAGEIAAAFDLPPSEDVVQTLLSTAFNGTETSLISRVCPILEAQTKTMITLAGTLRAIDAERPGLEDLQRLYAAFLYKAGDGYKPEAKLKSVPTGTAQKALGDLLPDFQNFMERVAAARSLEMRFKAAERTRALHAFADVFLPAMEARKQQMGWLDFDDLILKARALLTDPGVAAWVLFRLDGGIDHILVDEAQDTSPDQWDVVRLLAQEFTSGQGARSNTERTIFVVGDQKQSIYSFQGADPDAFEQMRGHFSEALGRIGTELKRQGLLYSFRSASEILGLVDETFPGDLRKGMGDDIRHLAFKSELPGRVDLWSWIAPSEDTEKPHWFDPVDTVGTDHHSVQLAERIAAFIEEQLARGQITQVTRENGQDVTKTRAITPGDFLILVQRRSGIFHEIIRACKDRGLPMAGADRLRVGAELGVKDLTSLLSYLATPEDDLALAEVLRSPLCGISEPELFDLSHGRGQKYLRQVLEAQSDRFPGIVEMLRDLRARSDFLRPYELLECALTAHGGREKLLSRLGVEAEEGIAALLDQALAYERTGVPSLTGFLAWLEGDEVEIKRQLESRGDQIRVMTVHGAKGLEAPIVILPDSATPRETVRSDILSQDGLAVWKARTSEMPETQVALNEAAKARQSEERMRLLYVAMTRAESWLIACGAGDPPKEDSKSWYAMIRAGLERVGAEPGPEGVDLRLSSRNWPPEAANTPSEDSDTAGPALPDWVAGIPATPAKLPDPLSPSDLGGEKALGDISGEALPEEEAKTRGTALHLMLEHLAGMPAHEWEDRAARLLEPFGFDQSDDLIAQAQGVLQAPELQFLFGPDALAEVPVSARLPELGDQLISGAIDRLLITPERILAVDFKSNRVVPDSPERTPEGLLRQMGAYAAALQQIYPDVPVETAILWTRTARLMPLPHDIVRQALLRAHIS